MPFIGWESGTRFPNQSQSEVKEAKASENDLQYSTKNRANFEIPAKTKKWEVGSLE